MVVTSNLAPEGRPSVSDLMGISTVDRLIGMSKGKVIEFHGPSFRLTTKAAVRNNSGDEQRKDVYR